MQTCRHGTDAHLRVSGVIAAAFVVDLLAYAPYVWMRVRLRQEPGGEGVFSCLYLPHQLLAIKCRPYRRLLKKVVWSASPTDSEFTDRAATWYSADF